MMQSALDIEKRLEALRAAFDAGFASPRAGPAPARVRLLALRTGNARLGVRLDEVAAIFRDRTVVPVPGGPAGCRGLLGARGRLVVVYGLSVLLEEPTRDEPEPWILQCAGDPTVGLAFGELLGYREAAAEHLRPAPRSEGSELVREHWQDGAAVSPVIGISSVLESIARLAGSRERSR